MSQAVTSWFIDQLNSRATEPVRKLSIQTSDYSDRVRRWPTIKRTSNEFRAINPKIDLANTDGALNHFYSTRYTIPGDVEIKFGFTHPTSGDELITVYFGKLSTITYTEKFCQLRLEDKLHDFSTKTVGTSSIPVSFSAQIPSDIAWTLCTCYGELSNVQSISNPDINYTAFQAWASVLSTDGLTLQTHWDGQRVAECLVDIAKMTDSVIWQDAIGKISFNRWVDASSLDTVLNESDYTGLLLSVEGQGLINKQWVEFDYAVDSNYWQRSVFDINTTSVNTFDLHDHVLKSEKVWYTSSAGALNLAQRRVRLLQDPPRKFSVETVMKGIELDIGDSIRLVDSFYDVSSATAWRILEHQINLDTGEIGYFIDASALDRAFRLDVSAMDSSDVLG